MSCSTAAGPKQLRFPARITSYMPASGQLPYSPGFPGPFALDLAQRLILGPLGSVIASMNNEARVVISATSGVKTSRVSPGTDTCRRARLRSCKSQQGLQSSKPRWPAAVELPGASNFSSLRIAGQQPGLHKQSAMILYLQASFCFHISLISSFSQRFSNSLLILVLRDSENTKAFSKISRLSLHVVLELFM